MTDGPTADTLQCEANEIGNLVRDLNTAIQRGHWAEVESLFEDVEECATRGVRSASVLSDKQEEGTA